MNDTSWQTIHRRDLLTVKQLEEFIEFCAADGWTHCHAKGDYEVLRMRKLNDWLLVHCRSSTHAGNEPVHLTVQGNSAMMAARFYKERKRRK